MKIEAKTDATAAAKLDGNILIVDDSTVTRQVERRILRNLGYDRVIEATNGLEALERVFAPGERIGLILLDWNMPMLNGIQFLNGLMKHPAGRRIPAIMVSAESTRDRILEAMCAGVKSYVIKPFHPNELRVKIAEALRLAEMDSTRSRSTLAGSLSEIGLPAVVQLASAIGLTGTVAVRRGEAQVGEIGIESGEVKRCAFNDLAGDDAFLALATTREGVFDFRAGAPGCEGNVTRPTMMLLMEAMRRQDEALRAG